MDNINNLWDDSSTRENNRLKSGTLGETFKESPNSNLPRPILPSLDITDLQFSYNDLKKNVKVPNFLDTFLAEDIGVQIGDGCVHDWVKSNGVRKYRVECVGNIVEDVYYLTNVVIPLKKRLFNLDLGLKMHHSAGVCRVVFESKAVYNFYTKIVGLPCGRKYSVKIPEIIMNSQQEVRLACLRGIADTDFSLSFKKDSTGIHRDPYIKLSCNSRPLIKDISKILNEADLHNTIIFDREIRLKDRSKVYTQHYIAIHGRKNLEKWMEFVGFHNPVHVTKYFIWKKFGFCPPKTNLKQRVSILNGKLNPLVFEK